ncbi:MAG: N-glycosylase/DNA lyase [Candidatus Caldarchaeum sp.]
MKPSQLTKEYEKFKQSISNALQSFRETRKNPQTVLEELVFCLCTPQTKARNALKAVEEIKNQGLLTKPDLPRISEILRRSGVRFHRKKAENIMSVFKIFPAIIDKINENHNQKLDMLRDFLVENVKGLGMKEASHFLRNIGYENVAIIDRHILKFLQTQRIVKKKVRNITKKQYLQLEKKFIEQAGKYGLSPAELDLLVWAVYTGEVLK